MKKYILGLLIISTLSLFGCTGNNAASSTSKTESKSSTNKTTESVKVDFEPIKPGTVPQLSEQQKKQVDTKLNSAVSNVNNALKSLQDPKDIDLGTTN